MANEQVIGSEDGIDTKTRPSGIDDGTAPTKGPSEVRKPDAEKRLDPSAPAETGTTPGSNGK